MTVICWDGKTLAADKRGADNGLACTVTKIRRIGDLLVGCSGNFSLGQDVFAWIERGRKPEDFTALQRDKEDWTNILVIENRKILKYERSPYPFEVEDKFYAIGSGRDFAISAMHLGKTATEAVAIASLFECGCGNGVDSLEP